MSGSELICPHCAYKASLSLFENVGGGELKCRRCRSRFMDPNAFAADVSYADCDSRRAVTRFPFALNGENALIRVRDGYLAFLVGSAGQRLWIDGHDCPIRDWSGGFQVYYVCLSPRVIWGTGGLEGFGAYGSAQLSLSKEYVKSFCGTDGHVQALEEHLKKLVSRHVTGFVNTEIQRQNASLLEHRDYYLNLLGVLEDGVSLTRIDPMGFRNAAGNTGFFSSYIPMTPPEESAEPLPPMRPPVEFLQAPKVPYTVNNGTEDIFCFGAFGGERSRAAERMEESGIGRLLRPRAKETERHKAGEKIEADALRGVGKLLRYRTKEFEFPFGWGIYNQPQAASGYYAAQGTISFFIDSTERFSMLLRKTRSWQEFAEQFFTNILKKELAAALGEILHERIRSSFQPEKIGESLSAMSVELTDTLNGEGPSGQEPVFRPYGLRVRQTDILSVNFYSVRR